MTLAIYTDGACFGNPGPGGWAWVREDGVYGSGYEVHTTNQRMEVMAVLQALQVHGDKVEIYSDSAYVVNCFQNKWWRGWEAKGWKNAKGAPVANQDLWRPLIALYKTREGINFNKVKGHSGVPLNERADQLANEQASIASGLHGEELGQTRLF